MIRSGTWRPHHPADGGVDAVRAEGFLNELLGRKKVLGQANEFGFLGMPSDMIKNLTFFLLDVMVNEFLEMIQLEQKQFAIMPIVGQFIQHRPDLHMLPPGVVELGFHVDILQERAIDRFLLRFGMSGEVGFELIEETIGVLPVRGGLDFFEEHLDLSMIELEQLEDVHLIARFRHFAPDAPDRRASRIPYAP